MSDRTRISLSIALVLLIVGALAWTFPVDRNAANEVTPQPGPLPATAARRVFERGVDDLLVSLDSLSNALTRRSDADAQRLFLQARGRYKRIESLMTLVTPLVSGWLNGPPAEDEDDIPRPPGVTGGFQVVEGSLFPELDDEAADDAGLTVRRMRTALTGFRDLLPRLPLRQAEVLDAARLEIARISTLGIAGFDTDGSGAALFEAAEAFEGLQQLNAALTRPDSAIDRTLRMGATYLRAHRDFEEFNRLEFLVGYAGPAARAIVDARRELPPAGARRQRIWRLDAATVFEANAFDPAGFASFDAPPPSNRLIALGKQLFFDPRLSGPGTRSCATCHDPRHGFADGKARSPLVNSGLSQRNTPTLLNAAYQPLLFYDGRAGSLEAQVDSVLAHPQEMASSGGRAAENLRGDSAMRLAFSQALTNRSEARLTAGSVRLALAAYVRALTALNSRFDRAVRGDTLALTALERRGFTVYMGKGRCGTCHFLPFFNGTAPPTFASSEGEIIGVPDRAVTSRARLDPDSGKGGFTRLPIHLFTFKVPTLRNVALTAPYMHNGAYRTLDQVVDFYDRGGGRGIGAEVPGQTLPERKLQLTPAERRALIAFMGALTDTMTLGRGGY